MLSNYVRRVIGIIGVQETAPLQSIAVAFAARVLWADAVTMAAGEVSNAVDWAGPGVDIVISAPHSDMGQDAATTAVSAILDAATRDWTGTTVWEAFRVGGIRQELWPSALADFCLGALGHGVSIGDDFGAEWARAELNIGKILETPWRHNAETILDNAARDYVDATIAAEEE